ncbi:MAG TPA: acetylxylan esterase [Tepiditoga sp.]|nr:acetylxylan esterase [Tepiditoga sp.]
MIYDYDREELIYENYKENDYCVYKLNTVYSDEKMYVHVFEPEKKVLGDIVFVHGIGGRNIKYLQWYGRFFSKKGYRTSFTILPFHGERKPEGIYDGDPFYSSDPYKCNNLFHNSVKDVRRTIDLVETFNEYNSDNLYIMGVSMGGMIAVMASALDKRIKKTILMITGGNWRWINFYSPYTQKVRDEYEKYGNEWGCHCEKDCLKYRKDAFSDVQKNINKIEDIFSVPKIMCFQYDPLSYAKFIDNEVLFISGIYDKVIPEKSVEELYNMIKNKKRIKFPGGHKSSIAFKRYLAYKVLKFIK